MEDYEIVEAFENLWSKMPKNIPLVAKVKDKVSYVLLLTADDLRVYAELQVGVKGGIKETVYVFDLSRAIVADKLIVKCFDGGANGRGAIFPLAQLRHKVMRASRGRKELAMEFCSDALWDLLEQLDDAPLSSRRLRHIPSTSESLRNVIQAGIPSQGRQGGGAPGSH